MGWWFSLFIFSLSIYLSVYIFFSQVLLLSSLEEDGATLAAQLGDLLTHAVAVHRDGGENRFFGGAHVASGWLLAP